MEVIISSISTLLEELCNVLMKYTKEGINRGRGVMNLVQSEDLISPCVLKSSAPNA
jgi:hypothetical protein